MRRKLNGISKQIKVGLSMVVIAVLALTLTAYFYTNPPGRSTLVFETDDASSIDVGTDVRVAGIGVGQVTKLRIKENAVEVQLELDSETFIGDKTRVDVRMLTPVGGYAVTLIPLGDRPLGSSVIPVDRVSVPYSIGDVLQAAPTVTDQVEGSTIDANIGQVSRALERNPDSVDAIIDGMGSLATVMDKQRSQVGQIFDMTSKYFDTFDASKEMIFDMIVDLDSVLVTYNNTYSGFNEAYRLLGDTLSRLVPLEKFFLNHEPQFRPVILGLSDAVKEAQRNMKPAIDTLQLLRDRLAAWVTPQGMLAMSDGKLMASDICIPVRGVTC
ncbi:MlaD family protein [Gordonia sp. KTR9]|uniref:MlaD family protein n=1 Tax=Gordonia sp. KTR9 TaxID=337191 RepID=UPI0005CA512D|nr:MlaD family protein [Gordonia sp. KTR9]